MKLGLIDSPQRVYFYRRKNGTIFSCGANEAYSIHSKYEYVGTSDGSTFFKMLTAERDRQAELLSKAPSNERKDLEEALLVDTISVMNAAHDAEMEEAKKDQTPPPNNQMHVEGQRNPFIDRTLGQIIGK